MAAKLYTVVVAPTFRIAEPRAPELGTHAGVTAHEVARAKRCTRIHLANELLTEASAAVLREKLVFQGFMPSQT